MPGNNDPRFDDSTETELRTPGEATRTTGAPAGEQATLGAEGAPGALPDLGLVTVPREQYLVEGEIARGGMGRVLAARDRRLGRPVALKELLSSSPELAARFEREALMTARLQHPSIVNVHEAGRWPSGEPFYAMKRVVGRPLDKVVREAGSVEERLALLPKVLAVSEALAYAHEQGVIHRDLKPANVLVGSFGETVVVDWGLAKDLLRAGGFEEGQGTLSTGRSDEDSGTPHATPDTLTVVGTVLGTPSYMAPEQARGEALDERADVYALGAILYTVLAGSPPYVGPSSTAVLAEVLKGPPMPLEEKQAGLPEDLLAIVRKAMSARREERYRTAGELSEDLRRYQTGQLVGAHRYGTGELLRRWVRKHRAAVAVATAAVLALAIGGTLAVRRIQNERDVARSQRVQAEKARAEADARRADLILSQARMLVEPDPTAALAWLKLYPERAPDWGVARNIASDARRRTLASHVLQAHESFVRDVRFSPDRRRIASGSSDRRVVVWNLEDGSSKTLAGHTEMVDSVAFSPDGRWVASAGGDAVRLWSVGGNQVARVLMDTSGGSRCAELAFARHGDVLVCGGKGALRLVDVATGKVRSLGSRSERYESIRFSPDGESLAAQSAKGLSTWRHGVVRLLPTVNAFDYSPDGRWLATGRADGAVELWDASSTTSRRLGRHGAANDDEKTRDVRAVAFSPDSRRIASAGADRTVRVWDAATGAHRVVGLLAGDPWSVAFVRDGAGLITLDDVDGLRLWTLATGAGGRDSWVFRTAASVRLAGRASRVKVYDVSSDGRRIVSAGDDGTLRLWDVTLDDPVELNAETGHVSEVAFSADGSLAAAAWLPITHWPKAGDSVAARIWLWDWRARVRTELEGAPLLPWNTQAQMETHACVFAPDSSHLACLSRDGRVYLHLLRTRELRVLKAHTGGVSAIALTRGALATVGEDRRVRLWSDDGEPRAVLPFPGNRSSALAFSHDGRSLVAAGRDGTLVLWDTASQRSRTLPKSHFGIRSVAFSPDDRLLATSHQDGEVKLWNPETQTLTRRLVGHQLFASFVAFSPDGRTLASSGADGMIRLWDVSTGASRVLRGHGMNVAEVDFSPDGQSLVSAGITDSLARIWDLASGASRVLPHDGLHNVFRVRYSSDGRFVLTAASEGVRAWRDDLPADPRALHQWLLSATDLRPEVTHQNP